MEFNWFQYCPKCKTEKLTSEFRKAPKSKKNGTSKRNGVYCNTCININKMPKHYNTNIDDNISLKCVKCGLDKKASKFNKDSSRKSGRSPYCSECRVINNNSYYPRYREKTRAAVKLNGILDKNKYNKLNKEYRNKPENKIRLQKIHAIKAALKKGSGSRILGCDGIQARKELEAKLGSTVDWPNFTRNFQLDYIKPLSSFNLTNPIEISQAFNIHNLILKKRKFSLDL